MCPMALSYFSNCLINPEISNFQQAEKDQLARDYLSGFDRRLLFYDTTFIDPFLQPQPGDHEILHYSDACTSTNTNLLSYSPSNEYITSNFQPEPRQFDEYLKGRNNSSNNYYCSKSNLGANNEFFFTAGCNIIPRSLPLSTLNCDEKEINGMKTSSSCAGAAVSKLSSQSIAARQRRRKITSKTQELGKLIPGAHKMHTAQMLQAAYKYVKFLQAQVSLLQVMFSIHHGREETSMHSQELQILLGSQAIQEKLYSEEKCLVPKYFLQTLGNDYQIHE